ncbi:PilX N-terminal domain-containing pilus assembly protein [Halomonas sp. C05BenzN]|uniref:PilX N-terminal domain-containing pilus assembly protein n=1 Tax=Halomonas sp. C05BenzN TaxID=3411041 RepID=UPI003B9380C9
MAERNNRGAALVVTLVLLVVVLLLGLSSMNSTRLDESMAGNQRAAVVSLMAAEYGASTAFDEVSDIFGVGACGSDETTSSGEVPSSQQDVTYDYAVCRSGSGNLYSLSSVGRVVSGNQVISEKEVLIYYIKVGGLLSLSPITIPGSVTAFESPNSDAFGVEGETVLGVTKPAISTSTPEDKKYIEDSIDPKRIDNYEGGISGEIDVEVLSDANEFHHFVSAIWDLAADDRIFSPDDSNIDFGDRLNEGDEDNPPISKLTFIDGDYQDSGNFSGSGVLVVKGDAEFSGTPSYDGLIIVLGDYSIGGGGGGQGAFNGSILVSPYSKVIESEEGESYSPISDELDAFPGSDDAFYTFSEPGASLDFTGGGTGLYNYDFDALEMACVLLGEACFLADGDGTGVAEREILAWREVVVKD